MLLQLEYTRFDENTSGKRKLVDLADGLVNHGHNIEDVTGLSAQLAGVTGGLVYKGTWDPSTGEMPPGGPGWYYVVNGSGTVGGTEYNTKDMLLWNGTSFDKIDNTDSVTSVNGQVGDVVLTIPTDVSQLNGMPNLEPILSHVAQYPVPTGAQTGYVLKKTDSGLAFQPTFSGSYDELTNKPNVGLYPDPTVAQEGQILIGTSGGGGLEYQAGYSKGQVDLALSNKLDTSSYTGSTIQTKLNDANYHVLTDAEYTGISGISDMITGSGASGQIPKFVGDQQVGNGFNPVEVINDTYPGNTVVPLEVAVVNFVNSRVASNATGTYRKANVLAIADYESAPPTSNEADRYLLAKDDGTFSGSVNGAWGTGVVPGDVVYHDGTTWAKESGSSPLEGWTVFINDINKYAVYCVGTPTQWCIGSIGRPVDDFSEDTDKSKLVSDKIIFDLNP